MNIKKRLNSIISRISDFIDKQDTLGRFTLGIGSIVFVYFFFSYGFLFHRTLNCFNRVCQKSWYIDLKGLEYYLIAIGGTALLLFLQNYKKRNK